MLQWLVVAVLLTSQIALSMRFWRPSAYQTFALTTVFLVVGERAFLACASVWRGLGRFWREHSLVRDGEARYVPARPPFPDGHCSGPYNNGVGPTCSSDAERGHRRVCVVQCVPSRRLMLVANWRTGQDPRKIGFS